MDRMGSTCRGPNFPMGDALNCSCHWPVKLPVHGMEVVDSLLGRRLCRIVSVAM